jgi:hypothetical protein
MRSVTKAVSTATRALLDEMRDDARPSEDKLERARVEVARLRDLELEVAGLEARTSDAKAAIKEIKEKTLVDIFDEVGIDALGLPASGNMPPYEVELCDYYHANIPEDHRAEAFEYLRKIRQEDLIKTSFTIEFGLREAKQADRFARSLDKAGIAYSSKSGVPWNTLTAWFKAEHKRKPMTGKVKDLLGATVGRVVKVVKQKEKK